MDEQDFPAAFGLLASARLGEGRIPGAAFATQGICTRLRERLRTQTLTATLVHAPTHSPEPALARDADAAVLIAGEIYNRNELRSVLPEPAGDRADSGPRADDARLLLALFRRYGHHAFRLVNGRFAAVVAEGRRILLATDHAGSVPLYLRPGRGEVVAATEAKALARYGSPQGLPLAGARRVRRLPGLYQVPAGSVMIMDLGSGTAETHLTWAPPLSRRIVAEREAVDAVRTALDAAVRARLAPGATPLVVLSGGIDSSGVAALAHKAAGRLATVSMGTDTSSEFPQARLVADHLGSRHGEFTLRTVDLLTQLPHTVWASESHDPDIIEYLLPLTALYRALGGPPRRILTGYGADIPLAGMHREDRLPDLDSAVAHDMATFDGLNEMSPVLSAASGHWSTHPYWDRDVLDLLVCLEAGLKRRYGRDKWVLRAAMEGLLPEETVNRPKLGVHEGSGTTSSFSLLLAGHGVPEENLHTAKRLVVEELFDRTVVDGDHPDHVSTGSVVESVAARLKRGAA
ncbi:asparagine synthase-related protein [Streptomyces sp. NPDC002133]|uniref:asparagine synthase-related protein n=1 Tax=Streptomyces sp. NPDC002133 TaxID=3154409 RepID=UPI00332E7798